MIEPKVSLINPHLVFAKNDPLTTGIVYVPVGLAYASGALKHLQVDHSILDVFGSSPNMITDQGNLCFRGLPEDQLVERISQIPDDSLIALYAINLAAHDSIVYLIQHLRLMKPKATLVIFENSQAVTAYSLKAIEHELFNLGIDYVCTGDVETSVVPLIQAWSMGSSTVKATPGVAYREQGVVTRNPSLMLEQLDAPWFPNWHGLPLKNYWALKYAHGPFQTDKYLPLLTSRGCPYPCNFCVIPATNNKKWRGRSAEHVVAEMEHFHRLLGVVEFHIEDVDPTVQDLRTQKICDILIERGHKFIWKICSGTKVETLRSEQTIEKMALAGCNYISISPETGSEKVLKSINKPFNLKHAISMVKKMNEVGIYSQACFVLGYPGENDDDRKQTESLIRKLTRVGVSEIAQFIITPVPGSNIYDQFSGYDTYSQLNFSPVWRNDYQHLNRQRIRNYRIFLILKLWYWPIQFLRQPLRFLFRNFRTKMEMTPFRTLHMLWLLKRNKHAPQISYHPQKENQPQ